MKHTIKIALATLLAMVCMTGFAQEQQSALDNIFARKSVRSYTDEPVSPEQVETILKAAMAAPSGMNMQPWRFVVVTDQKVKDKLAVGFNKMIAKAPVVIIVCGKTTNKLELPTKTGLPTAPHRPKTCCWQSKPSALAPCGPLAIRTKTA